MFRIDTTQMCLFMNEINNEWNSIGAAVIKLKVTHGNLLQRDSTLYANLELDKVYKGQNVG